MKTENRDEITSQCATAVQRHHHEAKYTPQNLSSNELVLSRPAWADFHMEAAYWDVIRDICVVEDIERNGFIEVAKRQRPNLSTDAAVRLRIARYFNDLPR
jgi:hypothetical protein